MYPPSLPPFILLCSLSPSSPCPPSISPVPTGGADPSGLCPTGGSHGDCSLHGTHSLAWGNGVACAHSPLQSQWESLSPAERQAQIHVYLLSVSASVCMCVCLCDIREDDLKHRHDIEMAVVVSYTAFYLRLTTKTHSKKEQIPCASITRAL